MERRAAERPIAPALAGLAGYLTYADLIRYIAAIANHFQDRRVPVGSRALINIANPDLKTITVLASIDCGLIPMLAQPDVLRDEYPWDLVVGSPDPVWKDIPSDLTIDDSVLNGKFTDPQRRSFPERNPDDVAAIFETSGTTGRPKLVAAIYKGLTGRLTSRDRVVFKPAERITASIGGATKYGLTRNMLALTDGATVVSAPPDPAIVLRLVNLYRVTTLLTTPAFADRMIELMDAENIRCPTLAEIRLTGAMFTRETIRRIEAHFDARIFVGYGTSEIEGGIANGPVSSATYVKGYVGRVLSDIKLITHGTKAEPGRIVLVNDGQHFSSSIVGGKAVQHRAPFFEVPDLGYVEDGILYLTGRADEVYNFSGNIKAYAVIEDMISGLAHAREVAVVSGSTLGNDLDLVIGVVADRPVDLAALPSRLAERMELRGAEGHFKFVQLAAVPRHQTGKVDRKAIVESYRQQSAARS